MLFCCFLEYGIWLYPRPVSEVLKMPVFEAYNKVHISLGFSGENLCINKPILAYFRLKIGYIYNFY